MRNGEIIAAIEAVAPPGLQESWDNSGLQLGDRAVECTGVLVCVDVSPAVIDEAIKLGCNLVISHHPLLFKGLKSITGADPVGASVLNAVAKGITVYSCHTAIDNAPAPWGVSHAMAAQLGVHVNRILAPMAAPWLMLTVMVPRAEADSVRMAMFDAGAGAIDPYECCSFNTDGIGTFQALEGAHPFAGKVNGKIHYEPETRIDAVVPTWLRDRVEAAMLEVHPYETPAYHFTAVANRDRYAGLGVVGTLDERMAPRDFISRVKQAFGSPAARCTAVDDDPEAPPISRVAMCGGSGGEFIARAFNAGAQAYITADIRYHDFVDWRDRILLVDLGHFETEQCTKDIFYSIISQKFANFAIYKSQVETNPINYF